MSQDFFGNEWRKFAPHPVFNEWLPFIGTVIGLISSLVALAVALANYENIQTRRKK
jgi:hypothetical protein